MCEMTKHYAHPDDIAEHVASFALELTDYLQLVEPLKGLP
jgi:hypothetical protein